MLRRAQFRKGVLVIQVVEKSTVQSDGYVQQFSFQNLTGRGRAFW